MVVLGLSVLRFTAIIFLCISAAAFCADAEPILRLRGLDAGDLPAIRGRTGWDAGQSHDESVHV
jgi:hypothetical protein